MRLRLDRVNNVHSRFYYYFVLLCSTMSYYVLLCSTMFYYVLLCSGIITSGLELRLLLSALFEILEAVLLIRRHCTILLTVLKVLKYCNYVLCFLPNYSGRHVGCTSRGHTEGRSHRISHPPPFCGACLFIFLERRIQPFLSLVDREVEFCVLTI